METFLELALREFKRQKRLADRALEQVSDEHFFQTLGKDENSIALIIKHVSGNMLSRWSDFLTSDGEKQRNRDTEFLTEANDSRATLMARWEEGWTTLFDALSPLTDADLSRMVTIRGEQHSVLQAMNRQMTHYAYHIGQLVLLAKHFAGGQWVNLSIPRGQSEQFNSKPKQYLRPDSRA